MTDTDPRQPATGWLTTIRHLAARYERLLWLAVFVGVVAFQWPILKGYYYRAAHTTPPVSTIPWRTDLDQALAEARRDRKQVLVDFTADWCPPCIAMKHDVWPDPAVARALDAYVPLLIDVDRQGDVASRYDVRGIPTVLVLDETGRVVRQASFMSTRAMVKFLEKTD